MASVRITEFAGVMASVQGATAAPLWPPLAHQVVTIGSEAKSSAFNAATRLIRVQAEALACIDIGENPTATTAMLRFTAGMTEYFGVSPGHKLSAITTT